MRDYFYGWYMKCQSDTQTLAVIPAVHRNKQQRTCSIQIITNENVWKAVFSGDLFRREKKNIFIGQSRFGKKGIRSLELCGSMGKNILFKMGQDIGKAIEGVHWITV